MNREIEQQFYSIRRQIEIEWEATRAEWHDSTTDDFTYLFWEPFMDEIDDYQQVLVALMDELEKAQDLLKDSPL